MAGPRPDDNYNSTPDVAPQTGMPSDTLSVRANPNEFGAQVGGVVENAGNRMQKADDDAFNIQMQKLGIANEQAANAAEMKSIVDGGNLETDFKSLRGLSATNSKDQYIQKYLKMNQDIRASLGNPMAQKSFDQLINRRAGFTIQGMNDYAHTEMVSAYKKGDKDSSDLSIDRLSRYEVATDPSQRNIEMANLIHKTNAMYTAPIYGLYKDVPATMDPKTGVLKFADTDQGHQAQDDYDNYINTQKDKAYTNMVSGIAFDAKRGNVVKAVDFLSDHEKDMSPGTYAKLSAHLAGPYGNEIDRQISDTVINKYTGQYQNTPATNGQDIPGVIKELIPGAFISSGFRTPDHNKEVGGVDGSMHLTGQAADVVLPLGTTAADLKTQLASKGITPTEFLDEGTHIHVGWAPKGVTGATPTLSGGVHQSQADFLSDHLPQIIADTRAEAARQGQDTTGQDRAAQRVEARINELRSAQAGQEHSLRNTLIGKVMDPDRPITNMAMLNYGDQETRDQWVQYQTLNRYAADALERRVEANAQGKSKTYGTDFYSHLNDVLSGKVTDLAQLQDYFGGDNKPISNTGIGALDKEFKYIESSPQGQAFGHAEQKFLAYAHGDITGTNVFPGINPAIYKKDFDGQLMNLLPQIQAKRDDLVRQGKNPVDMFDPKNKDYVGNNIVPLDINKATTAMVTSSMSGSPAQSAPAGVYTAPGATTQTQPDVYKSSDDVGKALSQGKFGKGEAARQKAHQIIHDQLGGFDPGVPKPQ